MASDNLVRLVAETVAPISVPLFQTGSIALTLADNRVGDLVQQGDTGLLSRVMRGDFRAQLHSQELPGWIIEGNPARSGELYLRHWDTGLLLRFLKERRKTYPGGVPVAGYNLARKNWWSQTYQSPLPGLEQPTDHDLNLLLLWDLVDATVIDQGIVMRVVRTIAPGVYGASVPIDLSVELNDTGGMWEWLKFVGDDELTDFFPDEETGSEEQEAM